MRISTPSPAPAPSCSRRASSCPSRRCASRCDPPDLYERLRESTLAVGTYYKCPDCALWHFNSSAGFVAAEDGIVCTCCHVVLAEDDDVKEAYLVAADSAGHVFPVRSVLAADTESDTCFVKIDAPSLFLNVTAEFAPGSSGAPVVDDAANVVAQVASIADAGEPGLGDTNAPPSPSVPVRFCTATEEILRLTKPAAQKSDAASPKAKSKKTLKPDPARNPKATSSASLKFQISNFKFSLRS